MSNRDDLIAYKNNHLSPSERTKDLLGRMTLVEKLAQLNAVWLSELSDASGNFSETEAQGAIGDGIGQITRPAGSTSLTPQRCAQANADVQMFLTKRTRLGIPAIIHEECLSGFMARRAAIFPQIIGLASTWNPKLVQDVAEIIRLQIRATGGHQGLAPVLDISRDPRWGRLEETYGEDPYLTATLGSAYVRGLQGSLGTDLSLGIAATGKHFAAHGIPEGGLNWAPVRVGPRELREVHLFPFEAAVKEVGLAGIMNAYHELDGIPCAASRFLLDQVLRQEWGFDGIVVSDYNAIVMLADYHHIAADKAEAARLALEAGIDIELPGKDCYHTPLHQAVLDGNVDIGIVDAAVSRILSLKFRLGLFESPSVDPDSAEGAFRKPEQIELTRCAAQQSIVLLKNEGNLLPLSPNLSSIAVIGPNADNLRHMLGDYSYASFAELISGGVGADVESKFPESLPDTMLSVLEAIRQRVGEQTVVRYVQGCDVSGDSRGEFTDAVNAVQTSDAAVLVVGGKSGLTIDCTSGELRDRAALGLPGVQSELTQVLIATGKPIVLVLMDGRPTALPDLFERLPAILQVWLPGEQGGQAVSDVLFGDINPGGKLPVSVPRSSGQLPVYFGRKPSAGKSYNFWDYVDESTKPFYPFGYGLSYTQFEYSDLLISPSRVEPGGEVRMQCQVKNTGLREGDEVVQLYINDPLASVTRPVKELKGFLRLHLKAGQACTVSFAVAVAQLAFYNLEMQFAVEPGRIDVMLGSSSEDIRLRGHFEIVGKPMVVNEKVFFSRAEVKY